MPKAEAAVLKALEIDELYLRLGQKDWAFDWFDKASKARSGSLIWLFVELKPNDPLRSDPRFQDLVRRMLNGNGREARRSFGLVTEQSNEKEIGRDARAWVRSDGGRRHRKCG